MAEGPTGPQTHLGCQREILVLGVIGASVFARHHHRQNRCNLGKMGTLHGGALSPDACTQEHVFVGVCSIEQRDAAHQGLA